MIDKKVILFESSSHCRPAIKYHTLWQLTGRFGQFADVDLTSVVKTP
ncbi:hypothetical protein GNIT_0851 [Glaciecola nitratireducens FR1064]|uniref:Uncharacterized protein n=1 Tax=Glaciecola nitratireducens (strain JCM 12485 / KCTC 12276 / FR1064) TaxID=1085623 RepID=G4QJU7_GLANF|nr:hypothetical protein GNIT_0851 [Glaciecola nitratireducens FR1064]